MKKLTGRYYFVSELPGGANQIPKIAAVLILVLCNLISAFSQTNQENIIQSLLLQARTAIGDEAKLKSVKSFSLSGNRLYGENRNGEIEISFLFPGKYTKRETMILPNGKASFIASLDNNQPSLKFVSTSENINSPTISQSQIDEQKPILQSESLRWMLWLFLDSANPPAFEYSLDKDANVDGAPADVIVAKITDNSIVRLYLDKNTHRLLMSSYIGRLKKYTTRQNKRNDDTGSQEESKTANDSVSIPQDEVQVRFADYKKVDGLSLPHHLIFQSGEGVKEDWTISKFQINEPISGSVSEKKVNQERTNSTSTATNGLLSFIKPDFEIYAPQQIDLKTGTDAVEYARSEFKKYFGKDAPKIAVVLFDAPEQATPFEASKFKERGFGLLKWSAQSNPPQIAYYNPLGVIITESMKGEAQVLAPYPNGAAGGIDLKAGDVLLAVNGASTGSIKEFAKLMSAIAVGSPVMLKIKRNDQETELTFNKPQPDKSNSPDALKALADKYAPVRRVEKSTLAHEATHQLIASAFGAAKIPAWFDEGFASMMESPENRRQNRQYLLENLDRQIPFAELLTMEHPANSGTVVSSNGAKQGMPVKIVSSGNIDGQIFYAESMTLLEFLAETEGSQFIGEVAEELARNGKLENALQRSRKSPKDLNQLETGWKEWLKNKTLQK